MRLPNPRLEQSLNQHINHGAHAIMDETIVVLFPPKSPPHIVYELLQYPNKALTPAHPVTARNIATDPVSFGESTRGRTAYTIVSLTCLFILALLLGKCSSCGRRVRILPEHLQLLSLTPPLLLDPQYQTRGGNTIMTGRY